MPSHVSGSLRRQAQECLEAAKRTSDVTVREELLAAAAWLHDEALKIEALLNRGGGGAPDKEKPPGNPFIPPPKGGGTTSAPRPWA